MMKISDDVNRQKQTGTVLKVYQWSAELREDTQVNHHEVRTRLQILLTYRRACHDRRPQGPRP